MIQTRKHEVFNDEDDADANEYGDDHDNNNEGDSNGNGNCQIRSGVPRKGCLIICLFISFIQFKTKKYPFIFLVWLITDPRLYYPLHQEKDAKKKNQRRRKQSSVDVCLWRAVVDPSKLRIQEDHPQFKGVFFVKTDGKITSPRLEVMLHSFYLIIFYF